jgi:hypothetical protein
LGVLLGACEVQESTQPIFDKDAKQIEIATFVQKQLLGFWTIETLESDFRTLKEIGCADEAGITKDTIFRNFATLKITEVIYRSTPVDLRHPTMIGFLYYKNLKIPISFELGSSPEKIFKNSGPENFIFLEYNFPVGVREKPKEERFLEYLGLIQENFSLDLNTIGAKTMIWKGISRGVRQIAFKKK